MMIRPTHEPTAPGNPKDFTIDQHAFPKSAIARFANGNARVQTQGKFGVPRMRAPSEKIFCAQRVWDDSAETYRTIGYEEPYRKLADAIVSGKVGSLSVEQDDIATMFIALWNARHHARHQPTGDIAMNGVSRRAPARTPSSATFAALRRVLCGLESFMHFANKA